MANIKNSLYNINNEFNDYFDFVKLNENGRYPFLKAYIQCHLDNTLAYDCDVSKYAMSIYKYTYDFLANGHLQFKFTHCPGWKKDCNPDDCKYEIQIDEPQNTNEFLKIFSGDTLNSLKTPLNDFYKKFASSLNDNSIRQSMTNRHYKYLFENFDTVFSEEHLQSVPYSRLILNQFEMFAFLSHTIGNLFPCPLYFNRERANSGEFEFPDLLLDAIAAFYKGSNDKLKELFKSEKDPVKLKRSLEYCENWLSKFASNLITTDDKFNIFIEKNCFQDFVEYDTEGKANPKILWKEHSFDRLCLPEIGEAFVEYLMSINMGIITRGQRIHEKIINKP